MTNSYLFLANKIQRQLNWGGEEFTFSHVVENEYHEETEVSSITIKGLYHQATSYKQKNSADGSVTSTKAKPMILCMYEDGSKISRGDTVVINNQDMIVTGIENVQELNVACEISVEVNE